MEKKVKLKTVCLLILVFGLTGCGTMPFTPQEYPLRDGLIPPLKVEGNVSINNVQNSTDEAIIYSYSGSKLASNYNAITQVMVDQATKELRKNGQFSNPDKNKSIDIKVTYLLSRYIAFFWKSELKYTATLGNSVTIEKTVNHGSGVLAQDLNGCIAESVIDLLNDPKVMDYLAE